MIYGPENKLDFYERFEKGEFGNRGLMWRTLEEYQSSGYPSLIAIRTKGVGTRCEYNIQPSEVTRYVNDFIHSGYCLDQMNFSAMMPDRYIVFQGEIARTLNGLELLYSTVKKAMRLAFAEEQLRVNGLLANMMLRAACDASSYEWLMYLLDTYHIDESLSSIVEFSVYSCPLGYYEHLGQNTLIWEVRNY